MLEDEGTVMDARKPLLDKWDSGANSHTDKNCCTKNISNSHISNIGG